jgi:hypothetical protein
MNLVFFGRASHEAAPRPPLNNPGGPEGDTVTVDEQLLNTEYCAQHSACAGPRRRAAHRVPILKYCQACFRSALRAWAGAALQGRSRGPHCAHLRRHDGGWETSVDGTSNTRRVDEIAVISHEISQLIPSNYMALTRPARNWPSLPGRNTNPRIVILAFLSIGNRESAIEEEPPTGCV